ncbi:MAG: zinc dependent phospholipase C family protein, partial [Candidatus Eremiobacteraeota bacterium]|nr:zinc dependent phospholipase C family protein [Candidatus Eremiobacteraeota bacterium]
MPGPFTHIYTARRVADLLANSDELTRDFIRPTDDALSGVQLLDPGLLQGLDPATCAAKMQAWPKFAALGANGPDLFFFLQDYNNVAIPCDEIMLAMSVLYYLDDQGRLPDEYSGLVAILAEVNQTWAGILSFIIKLDEIWQKFLAVWNSTIGQILDAAGKEIDALTGGLLSTLGQAFSELANDLLALGAEEILSSGDVFGWFSLKMRLGYDEQAFLWSDMTHYRRTSLVPARMIAHARQMMQDRDPLVREHADQLIAFALGWVCHVGTDVVAHSFVNEQCGGPFRTHWQRHHVIENHIDAWNYEQTKPGGELSPDDFCGYQDSYPGLNQSALYFAMQIPQGIDTLPQAQKQGDLRKPLPEGDDQATQDERKQLLDTDGALPLWLAETIVQVFIEVYASPAEGGLASLQDPLGEGDVPHPRNLLGQPFQDGLHLSTDILATILSLLGVDAGMALDDLRKQVAPDPPFNVPAGFPLPWEVQTAYRFLLSWFKRSYVSQFDMDKPQAPTVFTPPSSDYNFGPPDFSGVNSNDNPIEQVCEAIAALLDWLFKTAQQIATLIND